MRGQRRDLVERSCAGSTCRKPFKQGPETDFRYCPACREKMANIAARPRRPGETGKRAARGMRA